MRDELYLQAFKRLPERFRKATNKDLYYVLYGGFDDIEQAFIDVKKSRNIDRAKGNTLDLLGSNVGQFRQGEDDELYRNLIKVRIIANMSIGSIPIINKVLSILVKDVYLGLEEAYLSNEWDNEPAAFRLILNKYAGKLPYEIIERIKAAGVRVLFELRYGESLSYKEKTDVYKPKYWMVNEPPCGRVPNQAYKGKKFSDVIKVSNGSNIRNNRQVRVNEIKSGGVVNK